MCLNFLWTFDLKISMAQRNLMVLGSNPSSDTNSVTSVIIFSPGLFYSTIKCGDYLPHMIVVRIKERKQEGASTVPAHSKCSESVNPPLPWGLAEHAHTEHVTASLYSPQSYALSWYSPYLLNEWVTTSFSEWASFLEGTVGETSELCMRKAKTGHA